MIKIPDVQAMSGIFCVYLHDASHARWHQPVCERPQTALQKAANRAVKGRLLKAKRRPFAEPHACGWLSRGCKNGSACPPCAGLRLFGGFAGGNFHGLSDCWTRTAL